MSVEDNKAIAREFYAAFGRGDVEALLAKIAEDAVDHALPPGLPPGREGIRQLMTMWVGAFSDLEVDPVVVLAEGDLVAAHTRVTGRHTGELMGQPATNRSIDITSTEILRVEGGLFRERWATEDNLGMFTQLGLQPPA